jgi:Ser/Thr protein kinase RdoA (MazF antagonist)
MNTSAKTHGLDGTLVQPDWPDLTLDEVRPVLANFRGVAEPSELLTISPRPFSAASVVATRGGQVFVKRHHRSVCNQAGLQEEHRFMAHLCAHGARVPRVFETENGNTAVEIGEWAYEVHDVPPGEDLYGDALSWTPFRSTAHAYSAGHALAKLHIASSGYYAPPRAGRPLVAGFSIFAAPDAATQFDHYVSLRPALREYLATRSCHEEALALLEPFHAELVPMLPSLIPLWTHNDLHASNLLWANASETAQATAVIDFGLADRTNAVHDLAHAIERNIVEWLSLVDASVNSSQVPVHFDHLRALLDGYESVRVLSDEEAASLAPMTALCHAEFALSETDYFLSVLHSDQKARMACEGYLVAHAEWFRGPGVSLLDELRLWSETRKQRRRLATR